MSGDGPDADRIESLVRGIVLEALGLAPEEAELARDSAILGAIPEFDSMAVVAVLTALEERFAVQVEDDEIAAEHFETLGSLTAFVRHKLGEG